MKYLNKYDDFILEGLDDKPIDEELFWKGYEKNCKIHKFLTKTLDIPDFELYRGIQARTIFLSSNPGKSKPRHSSQDYNWSNLMLSNLPAWKDYPRRDHSNIITTRDYYAKQFGKAYVVIPFNNSMFGVCPKEDVWFSFNHYFKTGQFTLSEFNTVLQKIFEKLKLKNIKETSYDSLLGLFKQIEEIDVNDFKKAVESLLGKHDAIVFTPDFWSKFEKKEITLEEYFNDKLSPVNNNFKLAKYDKNFKFSSIVASTKGNEYWSSDRCYFVEYEYYYQNIFEKIKKDIA